MEMFIEEVAHIPVGEAAAELDTTPVRILMLIRQGVMRGREVDDDWFVEKGGLGCFRDYREDPQKPGGCKGSCTSCGCSMGG